MIFLLEGQFIVEHWEGILSFLCLVGSAIIVLWSQRGKEIHKTDTANIAALGGLLTTRTQEKDEVTRKLDLVTSEYKQVVAVDVKEITNAWIRSQESSLRMDCARLREEVRRLEEDLRVARSQDV